MVLGCGFCTSNYPYHRPLQLTAGLCQDEVVDSPAEESVDDDDREVAQCLRLYDLTLVENPEQKDSEEYVSQKIIPRNAHDESIWSSDFLRRR